MTYREILQLYKDGKLEKDKQQEVQKAIEKHETDMKIRLQ